MSYNLFNIKINEKKKIFSSLKLIFGINYSKIKQLSKLLGINNNKFLTLNNLSLNQQTYLKSYLPDLTLLDSELKRFIINEREKYFELKCYKRNRYLLRLPVNGQRTRSNAKTVKRI